MKFKLNDYMVPSTFRKGWVPREICWHVFGRFFFSIIPRPCYGLKRFILKLFGSTLGNGVKIRSSVDIECPWNLKIGDHSWIGENVVLYSLGNIDIGANSVISQESFLCTGSHDYNKESFDLIIKGITIGDSCWLAARCFVHPGAIVESQVVVSAGSHIHGMIPENTIVRRPRNRDALTLRS